MPDEVRRKRDRVQGAVELGPRSMALLRQIKMGIEQLIGGPIADPGKPSEDPEVEWPENG